MDLDEDITPLDATTDFPTNMQGPMTRARMRQLNLEVSSFLNDSFHVIENRLLPNDVIFFRNMGEALEEVGESNGSLDDQQRRPNKAGGPIQQEFESASDCMNQSTLKLVIRAHTDSIFYDPYMVGKII